MAYGSMLDAREDSSWARKARGAFFTPPKLACFIAEWAIRSIDDVVCEPACGEAEFLLAALRRSSQLHRDRPDCSTFSHSIFGYEVHARSAQAAQGRLAAHGYSCEIRVGDFLAQEATPLCDAVIGNPPYVRFQGADADRRRAQERIAERSGVRMSALSSLWAPFLVQSALFLKRGGRLGMVLPAELLSVNYAMPIRSFLLDCFASVQLVTFDERVFPEVQEEVVVLLADGYRTGSSSSIKWRQCRNLEDLGTASVADYVPERRDGRWSSLFASSYALEALGSLTARADFCSLESWGRVSLGTVTGNNRFFTLSQVDMERNGLGEEDVVPLCPPGTKHLRKLSFSTEDWREMKKDGSPAWLFSPNGRVLSPAAVRYVAKGEAAGVDAGYKCRKRPIWWSVPCGDIPDAFVTYVNAYGPCVCSNEAGTAVLNSCHGIYYRPEVRELGCELLSLACWNSATLFGAEIYGRAYGGGMLKLEPREAARLPVPSAHVVRRASGQLRVIRPYVVDLLGSRDYDAAVGLVDAVLADVLGHSADVAFSQMQSGATMLRLRRKNRGRGGNRDPR